MFNLFIQLFEQAAAAWEVAELEKQRMSLAGVIPALHSCD